MIKSYVSSIASLALAAAIVLATWLPTVSSPLINPVPAQASSPGPPTFA